MSLTVSQLVLVAVCVFSCHCDHTTTTITITISSFSQVKAADTCHFLPSTRTSSNFLLIVPFYFTAFSIFYPFVYYCQSASALKAAYVIISSKSLYLALITSAPSSSSSSSASHLLPHCFSPFNRIRVLIKTGETLRHIDWSLGTLGARFSSA